MKCVPFALLAVSILFLGCANQVTPDFVYANVSSQGTSEDVVFHTSSGVDYYATVKGLREGQNNVSVTTGISGFTIRRATNFSLKTSTGAAAFSVDGQDATALLESQSNASLEYSPKMLVGSTPFSLSAVGYGGDLVASFILAEDNGFAWYLMAKNGSGKWTLPRQFANASNDSTLTGEQVQYFTYVNMPKPVQVNGYLYLVRVAEGVSERGNNSIILARLGQGLGVVEEKVVYRSSRANCTTAKDNFDPCISAVSAVYDPLSGKLKLAWVENTANANGSQGDFIHVAEALPPFSLFTANILAEKALPNRLSVLSNGSTTFLAFGRTALNGDPETVVQNTNSTTPLFVVNNSLPITSSFNQGKIDLVYAFVEEGTVKARYAEINPLVSSLPYSVEVDCNYRASAYVDRLGGFPHVVCYRLSSRQVDELVVKQGRVFASCVSCAYHQDPSGKYFGSSFDFVRNASTGVLDFVAYEHNSAFLAHFRYPRGPSIMYGVKDTPKEMAKTLGAEWIADLSDVSATTNVSASYVDSAGNEAFSSALFTPAASNQSVDSLIINNGSEALQGFANFKVEQFVTTGPQRGLWVPQFSSSPGFQAIHPRSNLSLSSLWNPPFFAYSSGNYRLTTGLYNDLSGESPLLDLTGQNLTATRFFTVSNEQAADSFNGLSTPSTRSTLIDAGRINSLAGDIIEQAAGDGVGGESIVISPSFSTDNGGTLTFIVRNNGGSTSTPFGARYVVRKRRETEQKGALYDINNDNVVDDTDVSLVLNTLIGTTPNCAVYGKTCDLNADSLVNIDDAHAEINYINELTYDRAFDVNSDRFIDVYDLDLVLSQTLGLTPDCNSFAFSCDFNADNRVDAQDVRVMANFLVGRPSFNYYYFVFDARYDINGDAKTDDIDYQLLSNELQGVSPNCRYYGKSCDFNSNGAVDTRDLAVMAQAVATKSVAFNPGFDVNYDRMVDDADLFLLINSTTNVRPSCSDYGGVAACDFNRDGSINVLDVTLLGEYLSNFEAKTTVQVPALLPRQAYSFSTNQTSTLGSTGVLHGAGWYGVSLEVGDSVKRVSFNASNSTPSQKPDLIVESLDPAGVYLDGGTLRLKVKNIGGSTAPANSLSYNVWKWDAGAEFARFAGVGPLAPNASVNLAITTPALRQGFGLYAVDVTADHHADGSGLFGLVDESNERNNNLFTRFNVFLHANATIPAGFGVKTLRMGETVLVNGFNYSYRDYSYDDLAVALEVSNAVGMLCRARDLACVYTQSITTQENLVLASMTGVDVRLLSVDRNDVATLAFVNYTPTPIPCALRNLDSLSCDDYSNVYGDPESTACTLQCTLNPAYVNSLYCDEGGNVVGKEALECRVVSTPTPRPSPSALKPDFIVTSINLPSPYILGQPIPITIANNGTADAPASTAYYAVNLAGTTTTIAVGPIPVPPIPAGLSTTVTVTPASLQPTDYSFIVIADSPTGGAGVIDELNEANNQKTVTFTAVFLPTPTPTPQPPSCVLKGRDRLSCSDGSRVLGADAPNACTPSCTINRAFVEGLSCEDEGDVQGVEKLSCSSTPAPKWFNASISLVTNKRVYALNEPVLISKGMPATLPRKHVMQTYLGDAATGTTGYLDFNFTDDRQNSMVGAAATILSSDGKTGGRIVSSGDSPLAWRGEVVDGRSRENYYEEERYYLYSKTGFDALSKQVMARNPQAAYEAKFSPPLRVCTDALPSRYNAQGDACTEAHFTPSHQLVLKLLGVDWTLLAMNNFGVNGNTTPGASQVVLGRSFAGSNSIMAVGEEKVTPSGVRILLRSVSEMPVSNNAYASFELYANNTLTDSFILTSSNPEYNRQGVVVILFAAFPGSNTAKVGIYYDKLTLTHGSTPNMDNVNWQVNLVGGGASQGASLERIQLKREVVDDLRAGQGITFLTKPQLMRFAFDSLGTAGYDNLSFSTGQRSFPLSSTDTTNVDVSYVRIVSSLASPFDFGVTSTNVFYVATSSVPGGIQKGSILYQSPSTGVYSVYPSSTIFYSPGVPPGEWGSSSFAIQVNASSIASGNSSTYYPAITVEEWLDSYGLSGWWGFAVSRADSAAPLLWTSATGTPYAFYLIPSKNVSATFEQGYTSPRGSVLEALSPYTAIIKYSNRVVLANYSLSAIPQAVIQPANGSAGNLTPTPSPSPLPTPTPGPVNGTVALNVNLNSPSQNAFTSASSVPVSFTVTTNASTVSCTASASGLSATTSVQPNAASTLSLALPEGSHAITVSCSAGGQSASRTVGSVTVDRTRPVITGVYADGISTGMATIFWTTNEQSSTRVEYGPTTSYTTNSSPDFNYSSNHAAFIYRELIPATTYHYRALSCDRAGNCAASADNSFATAWGSGGSVSGGGGGAFTPGSSVYNRDFVVSDASGGVLITSRYRAAVNSSSAEFVFTYLPGSNAGFQGDLIQELPLNCDDYRSGKLKIEPQPAEVTCGSVVLRFSNVSITGQPLEAKAVLSRRIAPELTRQVKPPVAVQKTPATPTPLAIPTHRPSLTPKPTVTGPTWAPPVESTVRPTEQPAATATPQPSAQAGNDLTIYLIAFGGAITLFIAAFLLHKKNDQDLQ